MHTFRSFPKGPFQLAESAKFLCGFTPQAGSSATLPTGELVLGFTSDGDFAPVVVKLAQQGDAVVVVASRAAPGLEAQVDRILSLDVDASRFESVCAKDPAVHAALTARPGFRPVVFPSPYEAAVWGVLAQRVPMKAAAKAKESLAAATGTEAIGLGTKLVVSPHPAALLEAREVLGIPSEKLRRLHGIAEAALEGKLDASRLRAMPEREALRELESLRGVGPWTASHILHRGAGSVDALPLGEPRVLRAVSAIAGRDDTMSPEEVRVRAEGWSPFRMWVCVLLVSRLAATPRWHGPEPRGRVARSVRLAPFVQASLPLERPTR
jgi:DNA-3-methyladenine glycosylase II